MDLSEQFANWADGWHSVVNIGAVLVAGYWTYKRFIEGRINVPKASLQNAVVVNRCNESYNWVHVEVTITNRGQTIIPLVYGYCRVRNCLPPAAVVSAHLERDPEGLFEGPTESDGVNSFAEVSWPEIVKREWRYSTVSVAIEPAESECFRCDVFVPRSTRVVYVESWIRREKKPGFLGRARERARRAWARWGKSAAPGGGDPASYDDASAVGWSCVSIIQIDEEGRASSLRSLKNGEREKESEI